MLKRMTRFWRDDRGCVPASEWMLVASILTLGTLAAILTTMHMPHDHAEEEVPALLSLD
jgi:hypothetical protein